MTKLFDAIASYMATWVCSECGFETTTQEHQRTSDLWNREFHFRVDLPTDWSVHHLNDETRVICDECNAMEETYHYHMDDILGVN